MYLINIYTTPLEVKKFGHVSVNELYFMHNTSYDFCIFLFSLSLVGNINGFCIPHGTWALGLGPSPFDTMAHRLPRIILFIVPQGLNFHGTLPLLGTYEIGPRDVV